MARGGRAQTTVDFAIAMGVFLVALTTIIAFMPTMTQPFTGGQENPLTADRIVAQLVDGTLGDPSTPSKLNATCTEYFFNGTSGDPCGSFDATGNVTAKIGVSRTTFVNVTVQKIFSGGGADPDIACTVEPRVQDLRERGSAGCDTALQEGPIPPNEEGSVTLARRTADLNGHTVFVVVKVWT